MFLFDYEMSKLGSYVYDVMLVYGWVGWGGGRTGDLVMVKSPNREGFSTFLNC